jgi:hypothetical protein
MQCLNREYDGDEQTTYEEVQITIQVLKDAMTEAQRLDRSRRSMRAWRRPLPGKMCLNLFKRIDEHYADHVPA